MPRPRRRGWRRFPLAAYAAAIAAAVTACSTVVAGQPVSVFADPFKVAGMRAVDGPTGLRPGGTDKSREVSDSDGGKVDQIAAASVSDIEQYWDEAFGASFPGAFHPVKALYSWNSDDYEGTFCDEDTYGLVNAAFCPPDNIIGWDRGVLLPALRKANGDMAITMVLVPTVLTFVPTRFGAEAGQAEPQGHTGPGRRTAGGLPGRQLSAVGRRGELAAVLAVHRRRLE